jgi:hypothetical protein
LNLSNIVNCSGDKVFSKITSLPEKTNDSDIHLIIDSYITIPNKIKKVTLYHNANYNCNFNNIPLDVEQLTIYTTIPILLLNLPITLKKLTLQMYAPDNICLNKKENWIKEYISNGKIKIPFGCDFTTSSKV